ncbi:hypothetical protein EP47_12330 [Legionella norrlandica]|uniref:Uncharacterized protein n=1 Tax=Legionella norrlandica TaxID=1498499 RepID=A0A0A2SSU9_9GAMM|nr:hypothetical protein [Legionella norrlandica]KGP63812.1 hypothetical protein EP47_12330 [Legionella norrlandica]
MHCDNKKFQYSGEQESDIRLVEIKASVYGTTMTLNFPWNKKEYVIETLSKIPLDSVGLTRLSIRTPLHNTTYIKKALEKLSSNGLISQDFAQEIITNYPNGHGGKMDLNDPFRGQNRLLMLAASSILHFNAQLEEQSRREEDTYFRFKCD